MGVEGLFLPIREKRLFEAIMCLTLFNYPVRGLCSSALLNFISVAVLPHPLFSESPTPQRINSIATGHCSISTSWTKGTSGLRGGPTWGWGSRTTLPSLLPNIEFQAILETALASQVGEHISTRGGWATPVPRHRSSCLWDPFRLHRGGSSVSFYDKLEQIKRG